MAAARRSIPTIELGLARFPSPLETAPWPFGVTSAGMMLLYAD